MFNTFVPGNQMLYFYVTAVLIISQKKTNYAYSILFSVHNDNNDDFNRVISGQW